MNTSKSSRPTGRRRRYSSALLIQEPPLQVLPSLAIAIGLNEAMFLQQLHFWTDGKYGKERDGHRWIYNTYDQWHDQFPFWSVATIRRIVSALESSELIISTTDFNDHPADRTKWYAVNYDALDALLDSLSEPTDHVLNLSSPSAQDAQLHLLKPSDSPLTQRKHEEKTGTLSTKEKRIPMFEKDFQQLDPVEDRNLILAARIEPPLPMSGSLEVKTAWMDLQDEWRRRRKGSR